MAIWIIETLLWAIVTTAIWVALWGFTLTNVLLAVAVSVAISLLLGNSWRS